MYQQKILVVDGDPVLRDLLKESLQDNDYDVIDAENGRTALRIAYQARPDLVILDFLTPELSGIEVCKRLRDLSSVPIIMLAATSNEDKIVDALSSGANDCVRKPFTLGELRARIRVQLRSNHRQRQTKRESTLAAGDITIDLLKRQVVVRGEQVDLTPTEFGLLSYMARHPDEVLSHERLLREGWGVEYANQLDYLRLYVRYLRNKVEKDPSHPSLIRTERGVGYYLNTY
ncbi:MAG: response regulator transcription factor [Caldilineaceae bacterium]|nr:response regulator transcription factor [Caldilineaceae bacterium]